MANLNQLLQQSGQFPPISIKLVPLQYSLYSDALAGAQTISNFIEYRFRASVVNPVSDFSFTFAMPNYSQPFTQYIHEGDIVLLFIKIQQQEYALATGLIDTIETQVTPSGETVTVMGRTLLGQWEDQGVFTPDCQGIFADKMTPSQVFQRLSLNTRISQEMLTLQQLPDSPYYVGMSPMESKLQVLVRYLEPFNCLVWNLPNGGVAMGKPNMAQPVSGTVIMNKTLGKSNCFSMRSTRSAATIPNFVIPILSSQTLVANQVAKRQGIANPAYGPKRLASLGHYLHRVFCVSDPQGNTTQQLNVAQSLTNTGNVLDRATAYGQREIARENMKELLIQSVVIGHMNENAVPYRIDQTYMVNFDRDGVEEKMYLYEAEYTLNESEGPRTLLMLTRMNTIVAGNNFQ